MSAFDSGFSASRNGRGADAVLEGANPMQSMDLGAGKHAAAATAGNIRGISCCLSPCSCSMHSPKQLGSGPQPCLHMRADRVLCVSLRVLPACPADPHADGFEVYANGNADPVPTTRRMTSGAQCWQQQWQHQRVCQAVPLLQLVAAC
jgi:hypothetical protein